MIGRLKGKVETFEDDGLILDVGGVGYHILCSPRTQAAYEPGSFATLVIETHVREDHFLLYGFTSVEERAWFRLLSSVQRVGAKAALTILNALTPAQAAHAIIAKDTTAFSRISGIGPKLAERIVAELKDKALSTPTSAFMPATAAATTPAGKTKGKKEAPATIASAAPGATLVEDAVSALSNLGYTRSEAYAAALRASSNTAEPTLDKLIKQSLKELAG